MPVQGIPLDRLAESRLGWNPGNSLSGAFGVGPGPVEPNRAKSPK